jgi:hypothetical protein
MRWCLLLYFLLAFSDPCRATERSWLIHEADLIVVGKLHPNATLPWFDGWHLSGRVEVEEVLFGPRNESSINYRYPGPSSWKYPFWPPPHFPDEFLTKRLWSFKRLADGWKPAAWYGFDTLARRSVVEDYIRQYKLGSPQ